MFQKGLSKILILFVVTVVIVAAGVLVSQQLWAPAEEGQAPTEEEQPSPSGEEAEVPQEEAQPPADETADLPAEDLLRPSEAFGEASVDWQTYRNEEYGFEMQYSENWDYAVLELPNNPIMFAPQEMVGVVKQSLDNIESDKTLSLTITFYDAMLFEGGILPYRNKSTEYIQRTFSEVEVNGVIGVYYTSEYIQDKGAYKRGEKTVTVDLPIENGYLSFHLFDDQYLGIFDQMLASFWFLEKKESQTPDNEACQYQKGEYEMRIYDSLGRMTGIIDGQIKEEIPNSIFDEETNQAVVFTSEEYTYEIFCLGRGNYQFSRTMVKEGGPVTFEAVNIPIYPDQTHRYQLNWEVLKRNETGATLLVDANKDGVFEKTIKSDQELTCEEFLAQMR